MRARTHARPLRTVLSVLILTHLSAHSLFTLCAPSCARSLHILTSVTLLARSVLENMPQVAEFLTNDFGVLVMPAERNEVSDAGSEEVGSEEEKMTLLHSPDRQVHTVKSFKSKFLLPDHQPEVRPSRTAQPPNTLGALDQRGVRLPAEVRPSRTAELPRGSYLFSVASVTSGATFGYL